MSAGADASINFDAPAVLRKWPSRSGERNSSSPHPGAYLVMEGTLDECIRALISKPTSQHALYEIHTAAQSDLIGPVLSAAQIVELSRLRDFL